MQERDVLKKKQHYFNVQQLAVAKGHLANTDSCSTHKTESLQHNNKRAALTKEDLKSASHRGKKVRREQWNVLFITLVKALSKA